MNSGEPDDSLTAAEPLALFAEESDARFRQLLDALAIGVLVQGPRSEVLFANTAAVRLLGIPAEQMMGKTSLDATPLAIREDGTPFPGADHPGPQVLATGRPVRNVVMGFYRPAVKDRVWLLVNADPQRARDGTVAQVLCTFSDVTARREVTERLRESERRYRQLVEKAPDIIYRTDLRGYFTYVNPAASRVMGYADSELLGKHYLELVREDHRAGVQAGLVEQFQRRIPGTYAEFVAVTKSGREVWIAQNVELLVEGDRVQGFQAVARDVTERKAAEEAVEKARQAALESSRLKSEFVANVSHELRTPLNGVIGMATLLLGTALDDTQREYARAALRSGRDLLELIDDILDFAKAEGGALPREQADFDLWSLVDDAVRPFAAPAQAKGLDMNVFVGEDVPRAVRGEPGKLRQALSHLLSNAVKFTPAGAVSVRVTRAEAVPEEMLRFEVTDTGIGVAPAAQERIFLPFSQADGSPARPYGGTGLGLAIAKRHVEAMGGEIGMRSEPGQGSSFWFTARLGPPEPSPSEADEPEPRSARVLVVEDNAVNQKIVVSMLENLGHRVEVVGNGRDAVEACRRFQYDVVLMDCQMPEMDGFRATALIREDEGSGRRTPIVALTASTTPEDRRRCLAAGMDAHLAKPVHLRVLDAAVRKWARGPAPVPPAPVSALVPEHPLRTLEADSGPRVAREAVGLFLETTPLRLAEMREAVRRGDPRALGEAAHSLKGAAAQLGARGMADLCSLVVAVSRAVRTPASTELLEALESEWWSQRIAFESEKARLEAAGSGPRRG